MLEMPGAEMPMGGMPGAMPPPEPPVVDEEQVAALKREAEEHHRKVLAGVVKNLEASEAYNKAHKDEYEEIQRLYRAIPKKRDVRGGKTEPGRVRANVANTELHRCIESVTSGQISITFGDDPWFDLWDPDLDSAETEAMFHAKALLDRGHEDMDIQSTCVEAVRSLKKFGRLAVEVYWDEKRTWKTTVDPETGALSDGPVIEYARPAMCVIPPWRFYMDPGADRVSRAAWVIIERKMTRHQLEAWIESAKEYGMTTRGFDEDPPLQPNVGSDTSGDRVSNANQQDIGLVPDERGCFTVHDFYGINPEATDPSDPDKKRKDPRIHRILVVNKLRVMIEGPNQYHHGRIPVLDCRDIEEMESAEGLGTGQMLMAAQKLVNENESLMQEMVNFVVFGAFRRSGGLTSKMGKVVRWFPGRIFDDQSDGIIEKMQTSDPAGYKLAQMQQAVRIESMRAVSGATTNQQAIAQGGTATETRTIAAESARRLAGFAVAFANQILRPFLQMEMELYEQFLPEDHMVASQIPVQATGPDGLPIQASMQTVQGFKADMKLSKAKARMKIATDLYFREKMSRNLNSALEKITGAFQTMAQAAPAAVPAISAALLPSVADVLRKQLAVVGINPNKIPKELMDRVLASIAQAEAARQQVEAQRLAMEQEAAALAAAQPAPETGAPSEMAVAA